MGWPPGVEPAFIMELITVRPGVETPAMLMARGVAPPRGIMVREVPRDGGEAALRGVMDRGVPADGAAARLRGAAAPAAPRDGAATRLRGVGDEIAAHPESPHSSARRSGASRDCTARKLAEEAARDLSGRLIHAQEEQQTRLAREFHDGNLPEPVVGFAFWPC